MIFINQTFKGGFWFMVIDFKELVNLCEDELISREYTWHTHNKISCEWKLLLHWMTERGYSGFNEEIGLKYCDETFRTHILNGLLKKNDRIRLRAVRMLISYQKDGDFEFRTPRVENCFAGNTGRDIVYYLLHLRDTVHLSEDTINNKKLYLYAFNNYLENHILTFNDLSIDILEDFYRTQNYTLASKHNCNSTLRLYLRYAFDTGITEKDCSIFVLTDNYKKSCKIPTTYEECEIRQIISSVNRASATGKRDYLILLLAAEYGLRSSDIVNFKFDQIDWDRNIINITQHKTDIPVEYPLLSSVGNAIIDYLKNGRPRTDVTEIIVAAESAKMGRKLAEPTIHSIVSKYMHQANIKNWNHKKHGAHSLRHSLASNMLKKNISMPIISTVLGHQNTASTKVYLSVDIDKLGQCPLPIPALHTNHYRIRGVENE
jgi:site-specific recombinase XerD